jgi:hypothetical protein
VVTIQINPADLTKNPIHSEAGLFDLFRDEIIAPATVVQTEQIDPEAGALFE